MTVPAVTASGAASAVPGAPAPATTAATRAAESFERMLLEQLTKQLAATATPDDDTGSAATSAYRDLLPGAMASALSGAGGIGIAATLADPTTTGSPT